MLQKRVVRLLTNSGFREHTAPLFHELNLLDIYKINSLHIGKFMFSYHNKLLPSSFLKLFTPSNQIHHYNTRNANWCSLPDTLRNAVTLNCFRNRMMQYLLK